MGPIAQFFILGLGFLAGSIAINVLMTGGGKKRGDKIIKFNNFIEI